MTQEINARFIVRTALLIGGVLLLAHGSSDAALIGAGLLGLFVFLGVRR